MKTLSVVCPVYEEVEIIEIFYKELRSVVSSLTGSYESTIIFVVDRGGDGTLEKLKGIAKVDSSVRILALSSRFGHQMSLIAGMDQCDSDIVIMMDSDLQHPPAVIPKMLEEYERGFEIVYTVRIGSSNIGFFKRASSKIFYRLINRISDVRINESAADFRLVSRRVVEVFQKDIREQNQFLRGLFGWVGFKSVEVPFYVGDRLAGRSKYSYGKMMRLGVDGIVSFSKSPLIASTFVGFIFAAFGFINAVFTLIAYLRYQSLPSGWTTIVILLSIFSGVQLIFLGIIGQYIGAVFDEVKHRPKYIIDEKINFEQK